MFELNFDELAAIQKAAAVLEKKLVMAPVNSASSTSTSGHANGKATTHDDPRPFTAANKFGRRFGVGYLVDLPTGGNTMTIATISPTGKYVCTVWHNDLGIPCQMILPIDAIQLHEAKEDDSEIEIE